MSIPGTSLLRYSMAFALCLGGNACTSEITDPQAESPDEEQSASPGGEVPAEGGDRVNPLAEAPAAFDSLTNGFVTDEEYALALEGFSEHEDAAAGLGPLFNAAGCIECHMAPTTGGSSQVTELRAGSFDGRNFVDHPGGSLINDRAIDASLQEHVLRGNDVVALRASLSVLGDGFVEAIDSATLDAIRGSQPDRQRGTLIKVPVTEAPDQFRVARFGWKNQHASLVSFAADAYVNEMGITTVLQPVENTSNGDSVAAFDAVPDPEDDGGVFGEDLDLFITFMRASKVPPRDEGRAATASAQRGEELFGQIGCATCHVPSIDTAPAGTVINGGTFVVPEALGDKTIHPFSDFLLHDVGTGDGIVQNGGQRTRNQMRTPPLWGLRSRSRYMHDLASVTLFDAIARHDNQAERASSNFQNLRREDRGAVLDFLNSL